MRMKINSTNIIEVYDVDVTIAGFRDEDDNQRFTEMSAFLTVRTRAWPDYRDDDFDQEWDMTNFGEFDVCGCHTPEEVEKRIQKFFDDLLINGYVDISTEKKRDEYYLIVY